MSQFISNRLTCPKDHDGFEVGEFCSINSDGSVALIDIVQDANIDCNVAAIRAAYDVVGDTKKRIRIQGQTPLYSIQDE